jgi:biopolymer transport protein ExbD
MRDTRRMRRMSRNKIGIPKISLTSLMDVFTILVFFLLVNSGQSEILDTPKEIQLPESAVESRPKETVVVYISPEAVLVQGDPVITMEDLMSTQGAIEPISARLAALKNTIIGRSTQVVAASQEVTLLADKSIPFDVIRRVLSTCTGQGYTNISLAVMQKGADTSSS